MTEVVNLANFANSLDSSGGLSTSALNAPFPVSQGGTGATTVAGARTNLGIGSVALQNANSVAITGGSVSGISPLAGADGGTGAATAAVARTNLGLAIDSDVFGYIANGSTGNLLTSNGSTWQSKSLSSSFGVNIGAGSVAPGDFFYCVTGASGKVLVQLHVHAYATYANYGRKTVIFKDVENSAVIPVFLQTMEWDTRCSGDGRSIFYTLTGAIPYRAYSFRFDYDPFTGGSLDNAYYSYIGT